MDIKEKEIVDFSPKYFHTLNHKMKIYEDLYVYIHKIL